VPEELGEVIVRWDLPRLSKTLGLFSRGAATRFFNLPSARRAIEHALRAESETISEWLTNEDSVRFSLDYFGGDEDWFVGYGVLHASPSQLRFTRTLRIILQRAKANSYVLWTAYPLLSPRSSCWLDSYDYLAHPPMTRLPPLFYYFLSNYLSVTSDCVAVSAVVQGTTDFWQFESATALDELNDAVQALPVRSLSAEDVRHLRYELNSRCLDETLPHDYVDDVDTFVSDLQCALKNVVGVQVPRRG
jgi:hypothetical protein